MRPSLFVVFPHLAGAVLAAPVLRVSGSEQRLNGCSSPSGLPQTSSLGNSTVSLFAGWLATGRPTIVGQGIIARPAAARGFEFSEGPLNLGDLGPAQFAQLRQTTS